MKTSLFTLLISIAAIPLFGQYISDIYTPTDAPANYDSLKLVDEEAKYASRILSDDMRKHLTVLASDDFGGRELGTEGNKKASSYIAQRFSEMGLPKIGDHNSYFQDVAFTYTKWDDISLKINGDKKKHTKDYVCFPLTNNDLKEYSTSGIVFIGYGIETAGYNDYAKADVRGKVILIYPGEPVNESGVSQITGTANLSDWTGDMDRKLELAKSKGVELVLIVDDSLQARVANNRRSLLRAQMTLGESATITKANSMYIGTSMLSDILGKKRKKFIKTRDKMKKKGKSKSLKIPVQFEINQVKEVRTVLGNNVLGYIEGSDPIKKDEVLIVSAHYDHIGIRGDEINNGADDNGSGTTTVLELTEAFAQAKKDGNGPRRSILFMLVTGEEKGLLGSYYYSENPIFPVKNTIADINIDMVGRVDKTYEDNPHYIYVIGSDRLSTDLHKINEEKNKEYVNLTMDYKYNDENDPNRFYFRSDHYNFARLGIPAIFFFNGTHADYHRPTDTVEKINFEKMESVGRHIFHLAWELANRDERIVVDRE